MRSLEPHQRWDHKPNVTANTPFRNDIWLFYQEKLSSRPWPANFNKHAGIGLSARFHRTQSRAAFCLLRDASFSTPEAAAVPGCPGGTSEDLLYLPNKCNSPGGVVICQTRLSLSLASSMSGGKESHGNPWNLSILFPSSPFHGHLARTSARTLGL